VVGRLRPPSTCVEPDHRELMRSVSVVLHRRIRDNEDAESKLLLPLFCEDTHTEAPPEPEYEVSMPTLPVQALGFVSLYALTELLPPPVIPRVYDVPTVATVCDFIENIWHRARLTPQSVVICIIYVDRLEARSAGVLLHARSWRPIVFASLLLASKVWHDVSYWNSDFSSICPMFNLRNINRMELAYLKLLEYNTIISSSQYAQYYFSLRHALRQIPSVSSIQSNLHSLDGGPVATPPTPQRVVRRAALVTDEPARTEHSPPGPAAGSAISRTGSYNFRSKYFMAINVPGAARLQAQTPALATDGPGSKLEPPGDEDSEPLAIPGRPQTRPTALLPTEIGSLLSTEIGSYDRKVARNLERSSSSAALAPWMRPPTPGEGGAPIEVPYDAWNDPWNEIAAPAAAPAAAQPQDAAPRRQHRWVGRASSM